MLAILSPSKTMDFSPQTMVSRKTKPAFLKDSAELIDLLRPLSAARLRPLMDVSPALAELNRERFQAWRVPFPRGAAKQALLAFRGEVYQGFELESFSPEHWNFAQDHLRILSGLYGLLRPLDGMLPYRLEMGTPLKNPRGKDLYAFWAHRLTEALNKALKKQGDDVLVNLASKEHFQAVPLEGLKARVVTPVFKDIKNGRLMFITFYAKRARGMMADHIIREGLTDVEELKAFNGDEYAYDASLSDEDTLVFTRGER